MLQKDFDIIISFAKLKSINPVITNVDTVSKQKFPSSEKAPYIMEERYQVINLVN